MVKYANVILIALCLLIKEAGAEEKYVCEDILTIKWGSKAGEIGEGFDHQLSLPYIIKANANNRKIYLYDNINSKIELFDYNGNHLYSFQTDIDSGNTMFFDTKNNIILLRSDFSGPKIDMRRYNAEGKFLNKFELTPENLNLVEYGYFFIIDRTRLIFSNLDNNRKYWEINIGTGEITYDVESICITSKGGEKNIYRKKKELIDKQNNTYQCYIEIKDDNGKALNKFPIDANLREYNLTCVDKNNFVYLSYELSETQIDPVNYEVLGHEVQINIAKYNKKGELILKQKLIGDYNLKGLENKKHSFVDIDIEGNIFQVLSKEDGVHILKWEQRTANPQSPDLLKKEDNQQ